MRYPTLVSFYCGDQYYYDAADLLREDCRRLGVNCDIREIARPADEDWADTCRRKIGFYKEMLAAHPEGIIWVDVDTRLLRRPEILESAHYDLGAFLRGFRDLKNYDPVALARTFHPGFLHFNGTAKTKRFVDYMAELEAAGSVKGTDDYFLEEAYRGFGEPLSILLFNTSLLSKSEETATDETCFLFGVSGNVKSFKDKVEQHTADLFTAFRQRALLHGYARDAIKRGKRRHAIVFLEQAHRVDPAHPETALLLAKLLGRSDDFAGTMRVLKQTFGGAFTDARALRIAVDACLDQGDAKRARANLSRFTPETPDDHAYLASRKFRLEMEARAADRRLAHADRPAVWWMETPYPGNFGDVLNPYIIEKLSGMPPVLAAQGDGILAIGSVIKFAKAGTQVWGTGTPRMTDPLSPDADYRAVRGPLTRELVIQSGGKAPELYGDAAMLLPLIHKPKAEKSNRLGLILHHVHEHESLAVGDVLRIPIMRIGYDQIEAFIEELCSCEAIISTSLHGLIVAHAYGIPTKWATFADSTGHIPGDGTKFHDHYQAMGISTSGPLDLSSVTMVTSSLAALCDEIVTKPVAAAALLDAAPFPVVQEYLDAARAFDRANARSVVPG